MLVYTDHDNKYRFTTYGNDMNNNIPVYGFFRHKYGAELLIDVVDLDYIKPGIRRTPTLRENFYSLLFINSGEEYVSVNGHCSCVKSGDIICSIPGEVWEWSAETQLKGYAVIFEEQFIISFFNDLNFLRRFSYLRPDRLSPFLRPDGSIMERLLPIVESMKKEIDTDKNQDQHILRAGLYGILILLDRVGCLPSPHYPVHDKQAKRYANMFVNSVAEECSRHHDVKYYADQLCISPNYLNKIVREHFAIGAKQYIEERLADKSKRLLNYTLLTINEISEELYFNSPSYFIRFFKRHTGLTPNQYRDRIENSRQNVSAKVTSTD